MNEMLCLQCLTFVALQHNTCLVMFNALCIMTIAICMTVSTFITIRYYMTIVVRPVIVDAIITKLTIYRTSFVHHHCDIFYFHPLISRANYFARYIFPIVVFGI